MTQVKCPICPETRTSRARLKSHMDGMHRETLTAAERQVAVFNARKVEDVVKTLPENVAEMCIECDKVSGTYRNYQGLLFCASCADGPNDVRTNVPCVCGQPLVPLDDDREYPQWTHRFPAPKCRDAIPAAGTPTKQDRADLIVRLAETGDRLKDASNELAELRQQMDAVDARLAKLDAGLTDPTTIRRATLSSVLDKLLDAGAMQGYTIVSRMLTSTEDGWGK